MGSTIAHHAESAAQFVAKQEPRLLRAMTVLEAISEVQKAGNIRAKNRKLKLRFPERKRARLERAIETLRLNREIALRALGTGEFEAPRLPPAAHRPESLKDLAAEVG
jgi:hypothetical protein